MMQGHCDVTPLQLGGVAPDALGGQEQERASIGGDGGGVGRKKCPVNSLL